MQKLNTPYTMLDVDILLEAIRGVNKGTCLEKAMLVAALRVIRVNTWGEAVSVIIRKAPKTTTGFEGVNLMSKTTFVIPHEYDKSENECYVFTMVSTSKPEIVRKIIAVIASADLMHAVLGKNLHDDVEFRMIDTNGWTETQGYKSAQAQGAHFNSIEEDDPAAAPSIPYAIKYPTVEEEVEATAEAAEATPAATDSTKASTSTTGTKQSGTTSTTATTEEAKKS